MWNKHLSKQTLYFETLIPLSILRIACTKFVFTSVIPGLLDVNKISAWFIDTVKT